MSVEEIQQSGVTVASLFFEKVFGPTAQRALTVFVALSALGSVMNIVRSLDLPRDLDGAAAIIARGVTRYIDIGETDGRPFYEGASVGMNAAIFREAQRIDRGDYRGILASIWVRGYWV